MRIKTSKTSGNDKAWHTGSCSDCGNAVDTRQNGSAFHQSKMQQSLTGSIFLLCSKHIEERDAADKNNDADWMPGRLHEGANIIPMRATA